MTETVGTTGRGKKTPAARSGKAPAGLTVERIHTTAGVHPYDEVTWERRDVVMTNWRDGTVNFEQRGVEFPASWSVNATNIVTSKYFRGAVGSATRESSLRQLIDRVVGVYHRSGQENGYFATEADAEVFAHELTWMLLHQVFSFNSPVWFNVGTTSPQQVSACLAFDTLVNTPAGLVPIGELVGSDAVGTKVFDAHGLTSIVATKANGVREVLRLHTKAGHTLDVTPDHVVWKSSGTGTGRWVEAGTLAAGDVLEWHRTHSYGESVIEVRQIAEASLAGWLQSDGFVGQYETGTNRSLTIEAMTVTPAELEWVTGALDTVFPDVHRHERRVQTQDTSLDCRRTRLYGAELVAFVERWGLRARGVDMVVPPQLFTAPLPVVACYLRSLFQAEGYVSAREHSTLVGMDMIGEELIRGVQSLLGRFGIFARVGRKVEKRADRHDLWGIRIQNAGDRRIFADEIGFIDPVKEAKLEASFDIPGRPARDVKRVQIARIESLGETEVYDIQTESGEFLADGLRVHNCFILAVDDTMESILNWYREEGLIFKGGSGAGLNLSRIRSSKELLSSGGTASGPVSFMRGADASAGTIKSGGATRRAAKMVVLDVDHPDIEEFVETKAKEEAKVRVLRDAGFDMDLGGSDITSVQYQNANNSVRVTDEFMRAVESGKDFGLRGRMTGEVIEKVDAKKLFHGIAEAAWACADPGIQYDGTINDWHTTPESGRISASNPCSEYMHLDNSSCNLASLNLLTFLGDDGQFDAVRFQRSVELIITAMDISICFADFPTDPIGETTRAFRQLGIGYANLGALLMATGHAYDSEGGRSMAAAITSLMTGASYKRSAELAAVVGPYDGYTRNASAHQRVMRKHAAANDDVRTFPASTGIHKLATMAWKDCLAIGESNGWRNAQASVLAPTGCLTADTLVTTGRGLARLGEIGDVYGDRWQQLDMAVSTDEGPRRASQFFVNGEEPTRRVVTESGYAIQGTLAHRIKVVDATSGEWIWRRMADVAPGDLVPMQLGTMVGQPRRVPLPVLDQAYYTSDTRMTVPDAVDADLAELVGYFMGDGSLHAKGLRFCIADADLDVVERLRILGKQLFGLEVAVSAAEGYQEVGLQSVRLARWWQAAGFAQRHVNEGRPSADHVGKGWSPNVPSALLESNDPEIYSAFLRGLFEADGTVLGGVPSVSTASESFAAEVRTVLLALGLVTTSRETVSGWGGPILQIRLRNLDHALTFDETVGFIGDRKNKLLPELEPAQHGNRDRIHLPRPVWDEVVPVGHDRRNVVVNALRKSGGVSRMTARQIHAENPDPRLAHALGYLFEVVAENADGGVQPTFDLSVPENVTYVAAGFVSHNTIGLMMDCDTTGIEPDLALVKFKKLVGGGSMQIVNQTVPRALTKLGYQPEQAEAIVSYVGEHGHVIDAPALHQEHYEVFDCAMGERVIAAMGHVRMMAAVQPFLSGAISKCVVGSTLITTENGLVRINSLHHGEEPDTFRDEFIEVACRGGRGKTDAFYYGGVRPVREIVLRSGHRVTGTPNHRVLVAGDSGPQWRRLDEVGEGDQVAVQYGADLWSVLPARFDDFRPSAPYGCQSRIVVPAEMTEELAFLLGAYASEGHTTGSNWTVHITNSVEGVLERVETAWRELFGVTPWIERQTGKCPQVIVAGKTIVEFLRHLGCGGRASQKRIPDAVLRSPRPMVLAFLQGLALDAYVRVPARAGQAKWAICLDSAGLLDDLQAVLTNLGIVHGRISKFNKQYAKHYDEVYASGEEARRIAELVPFLEPDKNARRQLLLASPSMAQSTADVVPGLDGNAVYGQLSTAALRHRFRHLADPRTRHVSRRTVEMLAAAGIELPAWVGEVLRDNHRFSPVTSVGDAGEQEVYDVSVPGSRSFVGNGVANHNTVNMPETATVADVERVYLEGWRLGLKALAIYRDNCKVGQPLSVGKSAKSSGGGEKEAVAQGTVEQRPIRRRLPKKRSSETVSFTVGGAEGYLTAGSYPDGTVGEIFVKLGKQGSTLSGVMDAFSMSISVGLQYGIPLEFYVSKFSNLRFEPAGMTDDPDLRIATSVLDYLFRRLALDHLPYEKRAQLGIFSADERTSQVADQYGDVDVEGLRTGVETEPAVAPATPTGASKAPIEVGSSTELLELRMGKAADAPLCMTCGTKMRPAGSCYLCEGCGSTSGCS